MSFSKNWNNSLILFGLLSSSTASAMTSDGLHTLYVKLRYGLATIKSELLESNDTTSTVGYGLGVNAGETNNFTVDFYRESVAAAFLLNETAFAATWQDLGFGYRWGWATLGILIANFDAKATDAAGESLFTAVGSGYGGFLSVYVPVRHSFVFFEARTASYSTVTEKDEKSLGIGPRLDIELGGLVPITKRRFDFMFGYRQRTYPISLDGVSASEWMSDTFLGLQWGTSF